MMHENPPKRCKGEKENGGWSGAGTESAVETISEILND